VEEQDEFAGMDAGARKAYILQLIAALKLMEKDCQYCQEAYTLWLKRVELAHNRGAGELEGEARGEARRLKTRLETLEGEAQELRERIGRLRRRLAGPAAWKRSVDPDLLEQDLAMLLGTLPGEGASYKTARKFEELETDRALEALKDRMGLGGKTEEGASGAP
jgi:hypothetical protein